MNANANIVSLKKGDSNLVRPRFSPGLLLRDDDLRTGVDYTRELSRLLFRSLFGCGVVCGLEVTAELVCKKLKVTVASGIALNCVGDPINVPEPVEILLDPSCGKEIPAELWVTLCRTEKCCAPRTAVCGCDDDDSASVCTREHEGFEIKLLNKVEEGCACSCKDLKKLPDNPDRTDPNPSYCWCANPCDDCYNPHYLGKCSCECCDGDCVALAFIQRVRTPNSRDPDDYQWTVNHSVRRFVRPVQARDPVVYKEQYPGQILCPKQTDQPPPPPPPAEDANAVAQLALVRSAEVREAVQAGRIEQAELLAKEMREAVTSADSFADEFATRAFAAAVNAKEEVAKADAELDAAKKRITAEVEARVIAAKEKVAKGKGPERIAKENVAGNKAAEKAAKEKPAAPDTKG